MQPLWKFVATIALPGLAIAPFLLTTAPAIAEPTGLEGTYLGASVDATNLNESFRSLVRTGNSALWLVDQVVNRPGNGSSQPGTADGETRLQGRIDLQNSPVSVRGTVVLGEEVEAIVPTLSYDLPVGNSTNVYAGAGYAVVQPGRQTSVGDRNGVVLTTGVEAAINRRVVIYGDVNYRPAPGVSTDTVRVQMGIGHRF